MKFFRKLFGQLNMSWPRVILFAVITGVYTGVINLFPVLHDTSFQDIAVTLEWWFLFAMIVIANCKKWWEAALKCFVFFLISQPLVYLVQVPFSSFGWKLFDYYGYWFRITLLTLPGAAVAFFVRKKTWISVLILSVATGYLAWQGVHYLNSALQRFPHHLLSSIFCFALALLFILALLERKEHRGAAVGIFLAVTVICSVLTFSVGKAVGEISFDSGSWTCVSQDALVSVKMTDRQHAVLHSKGLGNTFLEFEDENGNQQCFEVTVSESEITAVPAE